MNKVVSAASGASSSEEVVRELTRRQQDLTEAMQRLIRFQRQTLVLKNSTTIDAALDTMEALLIEVIDFAYASLQYRNDAGVFSPLRQICPDNIGLDYPLMEWVMTAQEVSVLPIDVPVDETRLRSLLFLPFGGHHIMLLWLEQDTDAFTQEQEALLSILSREMAAVLEAHHFRMRLEKTRAVMSDIIESVPLGLLSIDNQDLVQTINSTAEIAFGVRRREVLGADYRKVLPEALTRLILGLSGGAALEEAELSLGIPGREEQYLGVTISPVRSEDGSAKTGKVVVCRDLQLSRELRKLRELDSMKNDFLSLVTHELRTPLTSIMAYSETLLMEENDAIPSQWREYLGIIHEQGKHLCRLIDDVLDLTRMEAGKMTYEFEDHDPNEIIGTVIMTSNQAIEEKHHNVELDLDENIGTCRMAADRFSQALGNVLSNAIKYTNPGGHIKITSRRSDPFPNSKVPTITITVEDNGIGIAPENMGRVFSKFEMVEAVKNHSTGTGLSMAICKQIIEEGHGGKITVESKLGEGTKVTMQVPVS